jgi:hypothetical protein
MVMMEDPANSPTCAFGNFACSLCGTNAHVLPGNGGTLADIAGGVDGVESNQVARTFADTLGRRSSAFCGSFADVSSTAANVSAGAALLGLRLGRRLGCVGGQRELSVLARSVLAAEDKGQGEKRDKWHKGWSSHGETSPQLDAMTVAASSPSLEPRQREPGQYPSFRVTSATPLAVFVLFFIQFLPFPSLLNRDL